MSNKQARRAARAPGATAPVTASTSLAGLSSPRVRVSTGMMIGGGGIAAVSALLPWITLADGTTRAGVATLAGIGTLAFGAAIALVGVFILLRANHPRARTAAWGALAASMGIGAMALIGVLQPGQVEGARVAPGLLFGFAGGMVSTMGVRGLLERR
jgi:hypothetical protein